MIVVEDALDAESMTPESVMMGRTCPNVVNLRKAAGTSAAFEDPKA
jgi:hypothetical protein